MDEPKKDVDVYRDTSLRYLGYTNEVGEAFRSKVPVSIVRASYAVSVGYVCADAADKGYKSYRCDKSFQGMKKASMSVLDTLLWQMFASVIVPGVFINRLCAGVEYIQKKKCSPVFKNKWLSTGIGLISIPLIIGPIDYVVEKTMDETYRKWVDHCPV